MCARKEQSPHHLESVVPEMDGMEKIRAHLPKFCQESCIVAITLPHACSDNRDAPRIGNDDFVPVLFREIVNRSACSRSLHHHECAGESSEKRGQLLTVCRYFTFLNALPVAAMGGALRVLVSEVKANGQWSRGSGWW